MNLGIRFELLWSDNDVLQLRVTASNGKFGGAADVYVGIGSLAEAAEKLNGFPRSTSDERELEFGDFGPKSAGGAIYARFYCEGGAGRSFAEIKVESDHRTSTAESAHFVVLIEASAVDDFVAELRLLEARRNRAAQLTAPPQLT